MGRDKATLPWGNNTMLETVVRTVSSAAAQYVLVGQCAELPPPLRGVTLIPDDPPGIGPVGGLAALLTHFPNQWCFLLSCDLPLLAPDTLNALLARVTPDVSVVAYRIEGRFDPCCALYHPRVLPEVRWQIKRGIHSLNAIIRSVPHISVDADDATRRALTNVNTSDDLKHARSTDPEA